MLIPAIQVVKRVKSDNPTAMDIRKAGQAIQGKTTTYQPIIKVIGH